jgi:hypothetical protein
MFSGYTAAFATAARLPEGAPVGCLVPARPAWLTGERCRSQYGWSQGFEGRTARSADLASAGRRRSVARLTRMAAAACSGLRSR